MPTISQSDHRALPSTIIRKVKRSRGFGRWPTYIVKEDGFGLWLFSPTGSLFRAQVGTTITECEVGQGSRDAGLPVLHLIPPSGWWLAQWTLAEPKSWISIEICTPPAFVDGEWRFIDLELDLIAFVDGPVRLDPIRLDDEDEFLAAYEAGEISNDEAVAAQAAAVLLLGRLQEGAEPFGGVGWKLLEEAIRLDLTPLTALPDVPAM